MYFLDTDTLSLLRRRHARVTQRVGQAAEEVVITLITRIEILQGRFAFVLKAENSEKRLQAQQRPDESEDEWLIEQGHKALPKSPIGQAIAYAQSNWAALLRYSEHRDPSIDNNVAERMLRAQAIGCRNWTFLGSDRGGRTAAVLYSLIGTCKHHDIDPFAYLQDVLRRLPSHPMDQLDELLPDVWFASHPSARRK
jgi:hypothetical protein